MPRLLLRRGSLLALVLGLLPLVARAAAPSAGSKVDALSMVATFSLQLKAEKDSQDSAGTFALKPDGSACIHVRSPIQQEMALTRDRMVVYYPDRDLALQGKLREGMAPPMLEAILAGIADPAATLPANAKVVEQKREGTSLATRWTIPDNAGQQFAEMRTVETREGVASIEVLDKDKVVQRRFAFDGRVRLGSRSVPKTIIAQFYGKGGVMAREERWALSDVAIPKQGDPALGECARRTDKTEVREVTW